MAKKPMRERLLPPLPTIVKPNRKDAMKNEENVMLTDNFNPRSESGLDIICNMISILPIEYDQITEVTEEEVDDFAAELENHKPFCYYVVNNGCEEEEKLVFKRPVKG